MVRGPMIAEVTAGWLITNASARWISGRPASSASWASFSAASSFAWLPGRLMSNRCGIRSARRVAGSCAFLR